MKNKLCTLLILHLCVSFINTAPPITADEINKYSILIRSNIMQQFDMIPILNIPIGGANLDQFNIVDLFSDITKSKFVLPYHYEVDDTSKPPKEWKDICKIFKSEFVLPANFKFSSCTWSLMEYAAFVITFTIN